MWKIITGTLLPAFLWASSGTAQIQQHSDTVILTRQQAEKQFLERNISLLAEKLNIRQAEARILQARLWPNPQLTVDEVNLWATPAQLSMGQELPAMFDNGFGKNQQISAGLEQLIITAGKRKKLIALEEVSREMASAYFEELMRQLKIEFRNLLTELQYLQLYQEVFVRQISEVHQMRLAHERQVESGNINRADIVRLTALELELNDEYNELCRQTNSIQKELVVLMHFPAGTWIRLTTDDFVPEIASYEHLLVPELAERARRRPDLLLAQLSVVQAQKTYSYERAGAVPDLSLKAKYDRGGNFMYHFVGVGLGLDLPIFHRNQGNIRAARIGLEQARLREQDRTNQVEAEVREACRNLIAGIAFYKQIDPGYEAELDKMLASYTRNFRNRHVGILEFLDFMQAYMDNKKIILTAKKSLNQAIEELKYAVGTETF